MKLTSESKFFLSVAIGTVAVIGIAVLFLSQPAKPIEKNKLITPTTNVTGNKDAKTWLVEFSDFECPACRVFAPTVEKLVSDHKDTLFYAHRHFPLPQHLYSTKAAIAAEAAGRQGKFWEAAKKLYEATPLSDSAVAAMVKDLGLDEKKFATDSGDPSIKSKIDDDEQFGTALGINATPTFFLNGVKLNVGTPEELKKKVEETINSTK